MTAVETRLLHDALRNLVHAVKTFQFTPDNCPEKSMAAQDMDDALDDAKVALQSYASS